jgi:hypothetical protein
MARRSVLALSLLTVLGSGHVAAAQAGDRQCVIVVAGAEGTADYGAQFAAWSDRWREATELGSGEFHLLGPESPSPTNVRDQLQAMLAELPRQSDEPLWVILIGHGTFDGRQAKFNLRGPDLTAQQLAAWLEPFERQVVVVNCSSASSPFLASLAGPNRIVVTATTSGYQYNFARFGDYLSQAVGSTQTDLDKDGQTSLLEAYLLASARTAEFYRQEARLATEEALLDDTGDGLGTPASWFRGIHAVRQPKEDAPVDGVRAHQVHLIRSAGEQQMRPADRQRRDALEQQIVELRARKEALQADVYYERLLPLMRELAQLYAQY